MLIPSQFIEKLTGQPGGTVVYGGDDPPLKVRSLVGLSTLFAVFVLPRKQLEKLPNFTRRLRWFIVCAKSPTRFRGA